ncbi:MAG: hypothetical protein U5L03_09660 [Burkholderiaceae bacterium]|nr:hypothetical protein [Burkholderiaceae bacterium]
MAAHTLARLVVAVLVAAFACLLLHFFGHLTAIGIAAVGAATIAVPAIAIGSVFWGPNGLVARSRRDKSCRLKRLPAAFMGGLVVFGIGLVAFAHFAVSPTVRALGFLMIVFALESVLRKREFDSAERRAEASPT